MCMKKTALIVFLYVCSLSVFAQKATVGKQRSFAKQVPAGNFSGITPLGEGSYAVVDDKKPDGFYVFRIDLSDKGKLLSVENQGFSASGLPNRDAEDIVYVEQSNTLFINGEADSRVTEYSIDGKPTGRELLVPEQFQHPQSNRGIEALAYDGQAHRFWLTTEDVLPEDRNSFTGKGNVLRLQSFDGSTLRPTASFLYEMDAPRSKHAGRLHVKGVSAMTVLPDQRLLILERECYLPKRKIGAWVECKLFIVDPASAILSANSEESILKKQLLCKWRTRNFRFANYEGMCLGPVLKDGNQVILLVSDSQNQYGSLLKDWFKTILLAP